MFSSAVVPRAALVPTRLQNRVGRSISSSRVKQNHSKLCLVRQRVRAFSSKGKKEEILPPLPSPSKAKQEYLKTRRQEFLQDPQAKITQLNQELETVRDRATAKLDAEVNKSVWRKLTDPLKRYKHSMINIGAMSLAYMLAYTLFVKSKAEKAARQELIQAKQANQELQTVLQSLLERATLKQIAHGCLQEIEDSETEQTLSSSSSPSSSSWFATTTTRSRRRQQRKQQHLQEALQDALEKQLAQRIGESAMTEEQRQRKSMQDIWEESRSQVKTFNENPEQMLLQAILEEEQNSARAKETALDKNDSDKKQRRVFSM